MPWPRAQLEASTGGGHEFEIQKGISQNSDRDSEVLYTGVIPKVYADLAFGCVWCILF